MQYPVLSVDSSQNEWVNICFFFVKSYTFTFEMSMKMGTWNPGADSKTRQWDVDSLFISEVLQRTSCNSCAKGCDGFQCGWCIIIKTPKFPHFLHEKVNLLNPSAYWSFWTTFNRIKQTSWQFHGVTDFYGIKFQNKYIYVNSWLRCHIYVTQKQEVPIQING